MHVLYTIQDRTHVGRVRETNEDALGAVLHWRQRLGLTDADLRSRGHLFAVADGMGGHAAGEVASQIAIETLFSDYYTSPWLNPVQNLRQAIATIHDALIEQAAADAERAGMGTTLVAAVLHEDELIVANVGDSRAYFFHHGQLSQITRDHSWVAERVHAGVLTPEEAARHPYRNVITRSLGPDRDPTPDIFPQHVAPGDVVLLCSDGLSNVVLADEAAEYLAAYPLGEAADVLLARTLERGAPDNVSFLLLEVRRQHTSAVRSRWLFWLFGVIGILLLWFYRDQLAAWAPGQSGSSLVATPISTPSLAPTPTAPVAPMAEPVQWAEIRLSSAMTPAPDREERFGAGPGVGLSGAPLPERYVYYVQGPADVESAGSRRLLVSIRHRNLTGETIYKFIVTSDEKTFSSTLSAQPWLAVVARPSNSSDATSEIALEPFAVLAPSGKNMTSVLWVGADSPISDRLGSNKLWVFTVYGPGGAEGLGVRGPEQRVGQPVALWGEWVWVGGEGSTRLDFTPIDATPYEWQGDHYAAPVPENF